MNFVKLTAPGGSEIAVDIDKVLYFSAVSDGVVLYFNVPMQKLSGETTLKSLRLRNTVDEIIGHANSREAAPMRRAG